MEGREKRAGPCSRPTKWPQATKTCATVARSEERDRFDLDLRARRQGGNLNRCARRRLLTDVARVDLVHRREVAEVREVDRRLDEAIEPAAGRLEDRAQVREHLLGLLPDPAADLRVTRPQPKLARHEDESRRLDRL